jgi:hypothetical protein
MGAFGLPLDQKGGQAMKERWNVKKVVFGEKILFQLKVGYKSGIIMWVSPKLITRTDNGYFLELPIENVRLVQGRKDLILLPNGSRNLFDISVRCVQYSMSSWNESSVAIDTYPCEIFSYKLDTNHHAALVLTDTSFVEYRWKRVKNGVIEEGFGIINLDGIGVEVEGEKEDALASLN